jgi:hypothetical protein
MVPDVQQPLAQRQGAQVIHAIDLDQSDQIATRIAYKNKESLLARRSAHDRRKESGKTQIQIVRSAFEAIKGHQPESDQELNEWLATDEAKQATMFEPTLISRWGETGQRLGDLICFRACNHLWTPRQMALR